MKNIDSNEIYSTKDLTLATYISYKDIPLALPYDTSTQSWSFENYDVCLEISLELRNKRSSVEPLKWEATRRTLLGMVHDKKR